MEKFILAEKLKEEIGGQKVRAAVFHSFTFDPEFFENYLLPLFLPDVEFGDNKIQNTILWRKFQSELPEVTVYCDFHAKAQKGINLDYLVRQIDVKRVNGCKPCYHPKHSFIVLQDWSLLVISGSNNLTESGWCSNLEGVNFFRFKNKENFPRELKDGFKDFCRSVRLHFFDEQFNEPNSLSKADNILDGFFRFTLYTDKEEAIYFDTLSKARGNSQSFDAFLEYIKNELNDGVPFKKVEVISPYLSTGPAMFQKLANITGADDICLSIPFGNTDDVEMDERLFKQVIDLGFKWKVIKGMNLVKGYRFNHSKMYHLLGEEKVFTIVGSVNFTDMAWKGVRNGGNFESAVLYQSDASEWSDMLENYSHDHLKFTGEKEDNHSADIREDVFKMDFVIDWNSAEPTLTIINHDEANQRGKIIMDDPPDISINISKTVKFNKDQLTYFSNTPLIKVRPSNTEVFFYYYPIHKNIENKPLPANLNLNDSELLMLWMELEEQKSKESTLRIIDKFIERITDESGDILGEELKKSNSTLNLMATHLSGIINLNKKVFAEKTTEKGKEALRKMREYYLFTDNVDTIKGYRGLIEKMYKDNKLNVGFYWLLLNIIDKYFYCKYLKDIKCDQNRIENANAVRKMLKHQINDLANKMKDGSVTDKHLKWVNEILEDDVK